MDEQAKSDREFLGSLAKGLSVIACFDETRVRMTVADVARATDMSRAGARRILLTLHALGYVDSDGKYYSLNARILNLGFSFLSSQSWLSTATVILEQLRDELNESVSVTTLDRTEVVYVARFPANRMITMSMEIGSRKPAYCSAMGRVLWADQPEHLAKEYLRDSNISALTEFTETDRDQIWKTVCAARQAGYVLIDRELEDSLVAVSAPLKNFHGETLAAVNVCGHPNVLTLEDLETRCLPALLAATDKIKRVLV